MVAYKFQCEDACAVVADRVIRAADDLAALRVALEDRTAVRCSLWRGPRLIAHMDDGYWTLPKHA